MISYLLCIAIPEGRSGTTNMQKLNQIQLLYWQWSQVLINPCKIFSPCCCRCIAWAIMILRFDLYHGQRLERFLVFVNSYIRIVFIFFFRIISYLKCYINFDTYFFINIILTYSYIHIVFILFFVSYFLLYFNYFCLMI